MAKYSDWYIVELEGYLKGRLPDIHRFEAIKELSNHFAEHVDELVEKGMDPVEAEKSAINSFGSPRKAAINFLANSRSARAGASIGTVGMVAVVLFIFVLTFALYSASLRFQVQGPQYYFLGALGLAVVAAVAILLSTILGRKMAAKRFVSAWAAGILATTFVCLAAGKPQYAGIPDRDIPKMVTEWKAKNEIAFKLSQIDQKLRKTICTSHSANDSEDFPGYLIAMKTEAPKLLEGIHLGYIEVVGQETSGYLIPASSSWRQYRGNGFGFEFMTNSTSFPTHIYKLKYEKDASKAVEAWRAGGYPGSYYRDSGMATMAVDQLNFIAGAEQLPAMGLLELTFKSVGSVAIYTGLWLAITLICSWILVQLSNLTFQSSFRRKIA